MLTGAAAALVEKALGIANGAVSLVQRLRGRGKDTLPPGTAAIAGQKFKPRGPLELELVPIMFEIRLNDRVPQVEVVLRAVNYLAKPLVLRSTIAACRVGSCPAFEQLQIIAEIEIPAHQSSEVVCRRPLVESEIAMLRATYGAAGPIDASVQVSAVGRVRKKEVRAEAGQWRSLRGGIERLPVRGSASTAR